MAWQLFVIFWLYVVPEVHGEFCVSGNGQRMEYDVHSHVCCDGHLTRRSEDEDTVCCGTFAINGQTTLCCEGNLYPASRDLTCCGENALNTSTHTCADGQITTRALHVESQPVVTEVLYCAAKVYDPSREVCCSGVLHQKRRNQACCGTKIYDMEAQRCINDRVKNRRVPNTCQGVNYDPRKEICCDGTIHQKQDNLVCCGRQTIDGTRHECMNGVIRRQTVRLCGDEEFDGTLHICCKGKLFVRKNNWFCCGQDVYDRRVQICVEGVKKHLFNRFCQGIRYDARMFGCCGNHIYRLHSSLSCCGGIEIDTRDELCCNDNVFPKQENVRCCGNLVYSEIDSKCNKGIVTSVDTILDQVLACCGDASMDTRKEICCQAIHPLPEYPIPKSSDNQDQCCNGRPYDSSIEFCSETGIQTRFEACNSIMYDQETDLCCGSVHYPGARQRGLACCPSGSNFGSEQLCGQGNCSIKNGNLNRSEASIPNSMPTLDCTPECKWSDVDAALNKYECPLQALVLKKNNAQKDSSAKRGVYSLRTDLVHLADSWKNTTSTWKLKKSCKCFFRRKTLILISKDRNLLEFDVVENTTTNRAKILQFKHKC